MSTTQTVDTKLDDATLKQLAWKPTKHRDIALAITTHFLRDRIAWADTVDLSFVAAEDLNCIGTAWRELMRVRILEPMGMFKRSKKEDSKGRKVFKYRLASEPLARAFLRRHGINFRNPKQPELFQIA